MAEDSSCKVTVGPFSLQASLPTPMGTARSKQSIPLIQGFRVPSLSAISWEGGSMPWDSIHAVFPKIKGAMPGLWQSLCSLI